jgi:hypothetical protein
MSRLFNSMLSFAALLAPTPSLALPKAPSDKNWRALDIATPQDVARKIEVRDDPLETVIVASSQPIYKQKNIFAAALSGVMENDHYLRALINRRSGDVRFQFVFRTRYIGRYDLIERANYMTADGPVQTNVNQLHYDLVGCTQRGCEHSMVYAFYLPREALDWAASSQESIWFVRLAASGQAGDKGTHPKEIAGLLARADELLAAFRSK